MKKYSTLPQGMARSMAPTSLLKAQAERLTDLAMAEGIPVHRLMPALQAQDAWEKASHRVLFHEWVMPVPSGQPVSDDIVLDLSQSFSVSHIATSWVKGSEMHPYFTFYKKMWGLNGLSLPAYPLRWAILKVVRDKDTSILPCEVTDSTGRSLGYLWDTRTFNGHVAMMCAGVRREQELRATENISIIAAISNTPRSGKVDDIFAGVREVQAKKEDIVIVIPTKGKHDANKPPEVAAIFLPYQSTLMKDDMRLNMSPVFEALNLEDIPEEPGAWINYFNDLESRINNKVQSADTPSAGSKSKHKNKPRVKIAPPPIFNGLKPKEILKLVEEQGTYLCELDGPPGDILVTPRIEPTPPKGRKLGPREKKEKELPVVDLEEAAIRSSIAVMEEKYFRNIVENRRYAAEWEWKQTHKRPLQMHMSEVEYITPARLGEVPALIIGMHISGKGERLYPVCVEFPPETEGEQLKKLIFFPAGWLKYQASHTFLHGKRFDPTLKDFGVVLPLHWKDEYRKVHLSEDDINLLFS